tara:strand:+ start:5212 stop:5817 length:606 start_codon:yes stop_codon:yes gene_type:complete
MKALVFDFNVLEECSLNPMEFLFLYYTHIGEPIKYMFDIDLEKLESKKFIKIVLEEEQRHIELRQTALDLIELLQVEVGHKLNNTKTITKSKRAINQDLEDRLVEFRSKWKGLRAGSMGSVKACRDKLSRWMKENPEYTIEQILKAADMYIDSLHGDYRFLQRADYFVFKQEGNREESSRLSAFVDEIDNFQPENWTSNLN